MKLAVFVSGQGTLLQKLIDSGKHEILHVCGDTICPAIEKAVKAGIPVHSHKKIDSLPKPDLSVLAGFTSLVPLGSTPNKFINVHPSLLPAFGGQGMFGWKLFSAIKESQTNYTGCTVHFCNDRYDDGPIILQKCIKVDPEWTPEQIGEETHKLELPTLLASIEAIGRCEEIRVSGTHRDYIQAVHKFATEIIEISSRCILASVS